MYVPSSFAKSGRPGFMHGQAYLAETAIGRDITRRAGEGRLRA